MFNITNRLFYKLIVHGYFTKVIIFSLVLNSFSFMGILLLVLMGSSHAEVIIVAILTFITLQITILMTNEVVKSIIPKITPLQLFRPAMVKYMKNSNLIKNLRLIKDHNLDILIIIVPRKPNLHHITKNNFSHNGTSEYIITYTSLVELTHFMMIADF